MAAGDALSYDYQFSTREKSKFSCKCGAPNCRGSLAAEGLDPEDLNGGQQAGMKRKRLGREERKKLLKQAKQQVKRRVEKVEEEERKKARRCSLTSHLLPGDPTQELRAGPQRKYFDIARDRRLFLVRNIKLGAAFYNRKIMLERRIQKIHVSRGTKAALSGSTSRGGVAAAKGAGSKRSK